MNDGFMFKLAQIRSSYTRKRFGTINNEEKALIDYETFCLELIKDYEKLEQENKELHNKIDKAIEYTNKIELDNYDTYIANILLDRNSDLLEILKDGDINE